jgi:DNA-binding MarR family transcriptional regulator
MVQLNSEILRDIGAVARSIQSLSDVQFRQLHLQKGQFVFLTRICECPGINLVDLSKLLRVDKTTTTKAIQKLIKVDYVRRERDESDQRSWRLFPTERAISSYTSVIAAENHYIAYCFKGFTIKEKKEVCQLLARMRDNIGYEWKRLKKSSLKTTTVECKNHRDD